MKKAPNLSEHNFDSLMPFRLFIYLALIAFSIPMFSCNQENGIQIIPLSPFEDTGYFTRKTVNKSYFFAVKNFNYDKAEMKYLDSFVLKRIDSSFIGEYKSLMFSFYKYEKDIIDETFKHEERTNQKNLFLKDDAEILVEYRWLHGKFYEVNIYKNNHFYKSEDRKW